jgi:steroid delta-isomerase-like uncharacterized protein
MPTLTKAEMRAALEGFIKAWNDHNVEAIMAATTEDVVWINPATPGPVRGRVAAAADVRATFEAFPDLHFPMEDFRAYSTDDPKVGFTTWTLTGAMTGPMAGFEPTGKSARFRGVCVYKFREGLIAEHTIVFDSLDFVQQLGLIPREEDFSYKALAQLQRLATKTRKVFHV